MLFSRCFTDIEDTNITKQFSSYPINLQEQQSIPKHIKQVFCNEIYNHDDKFLFTQKYFTIWPTWDEIEAYVREALQKNLVA